MKVTKLLYLENPRYASPIIPDQVMEKEYTEDGNVVQVWKVKSNYEDLIELHGDANNWSIDALMKAGIDPASTSINTGKNSRLDGYNDLGKFIDGFEVLTDEGDIDNN
ncbi:hypothetical protein [Capybara microvirus Cap1_SP_87]|nr:hypothetical protein [Capybara microvirus Cap1_SP_87]